MRSYFIVLVVLVVLSLLVVPAVPLSAEVNRFVEDFTTETFKDPIKTTAVWDTTAGELKLRQFELTLVGRYNTPNVTQDVAIDGNYAYVAEYSSGLLVVDISIPRSPRLVGSYGSPDFLNSITVSGNYAYATDLHSGLQVFDISDPENPALVGSSPTYGFANGVAVSGDYAYVANTDFGLQVIDISDPTNPFLVTSRSTPDAAFDVAVAGDYAYVADRYSGLQVVDISDPTNPVRVGGYNTPGFAADVAIAGDYAYVADVSSDLQVIDISDPSNPTFAGMALSPGKIHGVDISGDYAYAADSEFGVRVFDISDPALPFITGNCEVPGYTRRVVIAGDFIYVANTTNGLQIVDIADPLLPPVIAGSYFTAGTAYDVVTSGDYAYLADGDSFRVIDISDPENPMNAGSFGKPNWWAYSIDIAGDFAYVAGELIFCILDISDPENPVEVSQFSAWTRDVAVSGDYAFITDQNFPPGSLHVVDISDPAIPVSAGYCVLSDYAWGVTIAGDYAYVADSYSGLQVIDISDPSTPTLTGSYNTPRHAWDVTVVGDYAFVADEDSLLVIDISDPSNPRRAGGYRTPGNAYNVIVEGDYAYIGDGGLGLLVLDISDPTHPVLLGSCDTPGVARGISFSGDYVYLADLNSGLQVIEVLQRIFDNLYNKGQSLDVYDSEEAILWARLATAQTETVRWELSLDNGSHWESVTPGDSWHLFSFPGTDMLWRSTHIYSGRGYNPACTHIEIEWLRSFPIIESINDIPNDQGRQVRISWLRSSYDYVGSSTQISDYAIYRKVDSDLFSPINIDGRKGDGGSLRQSSVSDQPELSLPPGSWDFILTVPALGEDNYTTVVPTLADSTLVGGMYYSTFLIIALTGTPGVYFDSPPDSGYSVDNLSPCIPVGFTVAYNSGSGNRLLWEPSGEQDFQCFRLYRGMSSSFTLAPKNLVHQTVDTSWLDTVDEGWRCCYKITAVDFSGNESDPASPGTATAIIRPVVPKTFALYPNIPNPFNPTTVIRYDIPAGGGNVTLKIFDVSGRLVRTLVDGERTEGEKTAAWDGRDNRGQKVASGVYFYRLLAPSYDKTLKMTLVQ